MKVRKQIDENHWDEATTFMDSLGRTVKTHATDSQGDIFVETEYDLLGRVKRTSNPYRQGDTVFWSRPRYDELGRVVETCAPSENPGSGNAPCPTGTSTGTTAFSFSTEQNAVGTVVTSTDASGRRSRSITNALGQLIRVDEATGISSDPNADLGAIGTPNQPTYYTYNVQGKLVKVQQGKPGETTPIQHRYFKYDSLGRLIRVMQPEQEPNANLALPDPGNNTSGQWSAAFKYNALGDLVRATDANGVSIINEYDKAKRVTKRCYSKPNLNITATTCAGLGADASDNTPEVTFLYDGLLETNQTPPSPNYAKGKLTRVSSSVSDTRYTQFDTLGRLTESIQRTPFGENETVEQATPRVSKYAYNFAGALIEQTYPSGRVVKNLFEVDGDLAAISSKSAAQLGFKTFASNFTYTAWGVIDKLQIGSGRWEVAKFNERHQVTEMSLGTSPTDTSIWKLNYVYGEADTNGNIDLNKNTGSVARQTVSFAGLTQPFVQTYRYDALYRITEARETQGAQQTWKQTWEYDRFGNRTQFANFVGATQLVNDNKSFPQIDPATNRFNPNQGYGYDRNGNLTSNADGLSVVFNGENKQSEVLDQNNHPIGRYYYDGEGRRVKKVTDLETTVFVNDGSGKLIAEYSNQTPQNPNTSYVATDTLLSVRLVTDRTGNVVSRRDFKPFGEDLAADGSARKTADNYSTSTEDKVRQRFTGYQKDIETGLDFAEARMYENRHGRFTAVDPLLASGKSANPQTFNRYTYVLNSPLVNTDPTGLQTNSVPKGLKPCPREPCDGTIFTDKKTKRQWWVPDVRPDDVLIPSPLESIETPETVISTTIDKRKVDAMSAVPEDNPWNITTVSRLTFNYFTGFGEESEQFGPGSDMTAAMRTSPTLKYHFEKFISIGGGSYDSEIYANATGEIPPRFGIDAPDGPWTAGSNTTRQFVGSYNVKMTEIRDETGKLTGDVLVELRNPVHFNSLMYGSIAQKAGITVPTFERGTRSYENPRGNFLGSRAMGRTEQTFWWIEKGVIKR